MSDHVTNDVYSLAQGPIHLARKTRERTRENSLDATGVYTYIENAMSGMIYITSG